MRPVQAVRVNSWALPRSRRACIRYPSYLISCSHSGPRGGASTSLQSCGLTHLGRPGEWPSGRLFIDFAITTARDPLGSTRAEWPKEDRHATGELERIPAPLFGVLPDLPVAGDGAHETHSPTSGLASNSGRRTERSGGPRQRTRFLRSSNVEASSGLRRASGGTSSPGNSDKRSGLTIRAPARKSRRRRSSGDTNMSAANSSRSRRTR